MSLRHNFRLKLVRKLGFGTPKYYIAPYNKVNQELVNLSYSCDVKSDLKDSDGTVSSVHSDQGLSGSALLA